MPTKETISSAAGIVFQVAKHSFTVSPVVLSSAS
jgi:hypothetical protein